MNIARLKKIPIHFLSPFVAWLQNIFISLYLTFSTYKLYNFLVENSKNAVADSCTAVSICSLKMKNILKVKLPMLTNPFL